MDPIDLPKISSLNLTVKDGLIDLLLSLIALLSIGFVCCFFLYMKWLKEKHDEMAPPAVFTVAYNGKNGVTLPAPGNNQPSPANNCFNSSVHPI